MKKIPPANTPSALTSFWRDATQKTKVCRVRVRRRVSMVTKSSKSTRHRDLWLMNPSKSLNTKFEFNQLLSRQDTMKLTNKIYWFAVWKHTNFKLKLNHFMIKRNFKFNSIQSKTYRKSMIYRKRLFTMLAAHFCSLWTSECHNAFSWSIEITLFTIVNVACKRNATLIRLVSFGDFKATIITL